MDTMFTPHHCGLFFTHDDVQRIRSERKREPLEAAWNELQSLEPDDLAETILVYALRYRLNANVEAGNDAAHLLKAELEAINTNAQPMTPQALVRLVQCFELLHDHPDMAETRLVNLDQIREALRAIVPQPYADNMWFNAASMALSIAAEDESTFMHRVDVFRETIDNEVHPEGYLPDAVEIAPEAAAMESQISSVHALVLMAAMARCVGVDLWSYEKRGVSVLTAASYPLYYYFYPEKWPWNGEQWKPSDGVEESAAKRIFQDYAGYIEMIAPRYATPLKATELILAELRPVYDRFGGGPVTLTHATAKARGILGLFR